MTPARVAVLMPTFGERGLASTVAELRARAPQLGSVCLFLVDDGSAEPVRLESLPSPTADFSIVLARHVVNLGQGAALETARLLALRESVRFDAFVTMDADGQHGAEDVVALVRALERADVALGDRFRGGSNVPRGRALLLSLARAFEALLIGRRLGDAHNGLRAFRGEVAARVSLRQNRMAHATEIVRQVHALGDVVIVEVPVTIRYSDASLAKGQRASGALSIASDLVHRYLFGASEP